MSDDGDGGVGRGGKAAAAFNDNEGSRSRPDNRVESGRSLLGMGALVFNCAQCGQAFEARASMLGEVVGCPTCEGVVGLPEAYPGISPIQKKILQTPPPVAKEPPKFHFTAGDGEGGSGTAEEPTRAA